MNTTINTGGPAVPQPATAGTRRAGAGEAEGGAPGPATTGPAAGGDRVQLTESARALGAATHAKDAPVDTQRVEHIRQAIANGTYKVDAQRVADRLISLEKQIG